MAPQILESLLRSLQSGWLSLKAINDKKSTCINTYPSDVYHILLAWGSQLYSPSVWAEKLVMCLYIIFLAGCSLWDLGSLSRDQA